MCRQRLQAHVSGAPRKGFGQVPVAGKREHLMTTLCEVAEQGRSCPRPIVVEVHQDVVGDQRQGDGASTIGAGEGQPHRQIQLLAGAPQFRAESASPALAGLLVVAGAVGWPALAVAIPGKLVALNHPDPNRRRVVRAIIAATAGGDQSKTIAEVSLTSRVTSMRGPRSRSDNSATLRPMLESPGEET